ncbi:hypothetical protein L2E82_11483 [Cichorium intybus]|uniref:Uncharacterized protein n=1 Tax=Cichorium intybus TaxID=13427 RepID=A0ACB9GE50_CICIN|nr:hypothetical protein L2E82_11483 [Cichorium intybus]
MKFRYRTGGGGRLMSEGSGKSPSEFPNWVSKKERRLIQTPMTLIQTHIVVSHDDNGTCKMIMEAIKKAPEGEGDIFKELEPIIEPLISLDPMTSALSIITCGEDAISTQELKVTDIESP